MFFCRYLFVRRWKKCDLMFERRAKRLAEIVTVKIKTAFVPRVALELWPVIGRLTTFVPSLGVAFDRISHRRLSDGLTGRTCTVPITPRQCARPYGNDITVTTSRSSHESKAIYTARFPGYTRPPPLKCLVVRLQNDINRRPLIVWENDSYSVGTTKHSFRFSLWRPMDFGWRPSTSASSKIVSGQRRFRKTQDQSP